MNAARRNIALLALVGLVTGAPAIAHAAPPPPPSADAPLPPPGEVPPPPPPRFAPPPPPGERPPPPPPRGAAVIIDRDPNRRIHVDVRCVEADTTRACADIATQLFDKANAAASPR